MGFVWLQLVSLARTRRMAILPHCSAG